MTTKSINDRLGDGGLDSVAVFSETEERVVQGLISPTGDVVKIPLLIAQSYAPISRTSMNSIIDPDDDTDYTTLATVTVPGGTMGLNSKLVFITDWDFPNSASTKSFAINFGVSNISTIQLTSGFVMGKILVELQNLNSLSAQKTMNGSNYGVSANARISTAINTENDVNIEYKVKWGAATLGETITLLGYSIWHYPGS